MNSLKYLTVAVAMFTVFSADATTFKKSFEELNAPHPIKLGTSESGYNLKLPYSPREVIDKATVHLEFVNSTALIKSRSALTVKVNGTILEQYLLDPISSKQAHDIAIPASLLTPGYNDIFIKVDQHYTYDCEDPASPELWTEVDSTKSNVSVDISSSVPNEAPKLSQLNAIFDSKAWLPRPVVFVMGSPAYSTDDVSAAGLVAQGIASRLQVKSPIFKVVPFAQATSGTPSKIGQVSSELFAKADGVLIGTKSELNSLLSLDIAANITGPFVGVYPVNNADSFVLVVSGLSEKQVKEAATSIANPLFRFPAVSKGIVSNSDIPPLAVANPSEDTLFSTFNWKSQSSKGFKASPIYFEFRAPSDYASSKGDQSTLDLHFAYGAGLRRDSSIAAYLNGNFVNSVQLSDERGAEIRGYELKVPSEYIRPGVNSLSFVPVFIGKKADCDMVRDEGFVTTIYDDSSIRLSSPTRAPRAPDLFRFSKGFWSQDSLFRTYITDKNAESIASYLSVMGLIAQKNKYPIDTEVAYGPFKAGHMFILGSDKNIAPELYSKFSLSKFNWNAEADNVGLAQTVVGDRIVTAMFSDSPLATDTAVKLLLEKGLWNALDGQDSVIDISQKTVSTSPASTPIEFKSSRITAPILAEVSNWKIIVFFIGLFIVLLVAVVSRYLGNKESDRLE